MGAPVSASASGARLPAARRGRAGARELAIVERLLQSASTFATDFSAHGPKPPSHEQLANPDPQAVRFPPHCASAKWHRPSSSASHDAASIALSLTYRPQCACATSSIITGSSASARALESAASGADSRRRARASHNTPNVSPTDASNLALWPRRRDLDAAARTVNFANQERARASASRIRACPSCRSAASASSTETYRGCDERFSESEAGSGRFGGKALRRRALAVQEDGGGLSR